MRGTVPLCPNPALIEPNVTLQLARSGLRFAFQNLLMPVDPYHDLG
jgi:hypothetical protein